jgi:hypothetical protein
LFALAWMALDDAEGGAQRSLSIRRGRRRLFRVALPRCEARGSGMSWKYPRCVRRRLLNSANEPRVAITRGDATRDAQLR